MYRYAAVVFNQSSLKVKILIYWEEKLFILLLLYILNTFFHFSASYANVPGSFYFCTMFEKVFEIKIWRRFSIPIFQSLCIK